MRQHPIPQNILDIEFKLFTKFTVREFVYMAVGVGFGGIFLYFFTRGEVPGIIAIPIFLISSSIGLFLGLVPINDQKADEFLKNYFVAITNPTRRVWRSKNMSKDQNNIMMNESTLNATRGTMERTENPEQQIIGTEEHLPKHQFVENAVLDSLDQEEFDRLQSLEKIASDLNNTKQYIPAATNVTITTNTQPIVDITAQSQMNPTQSPSPVMNSYLPNPQNVFQNQPTVTTTNTVSTSSSVTQLVLPKTTINIPPVNSKPVVIPKITITNQNIKRFTDTSNGQLNNITVMSQLGTPLPEAIVAIKDSSGKLILAQKTNPKGFTTIARDFPKGIYQLTIAAPKNLFPEISIEIDNHFESIKISAL